MKAKFLVFIVIFLSIFGYMAIKDKNQKEMEKPQVKSIQEVSNLGEEIVTKYESVKPEKTMLISNLVKNLTATEAKEEFNCKLLTNAGLYTKEKKYLGLFVEDGKKLSEKIESETFNGFVSLGESLAIGTLPDLSQPFVFQSGPLFVFNETQSLDDTKKARRVILLQDSEEKNYLAVIYDKNNLTNGPTLKETKKLLIERFKEDEISLKYGINLDGGSASTYMSEDISLTEISPVGSFICERY